MSAESHLLVSEIKCIELSKKQTWVFYAIMRMYLYEMTFQSMGYKPLDIKDWTCASNANNTLQQHQF